MPRSPLRQRHGLESAWVHTPDHGACRRLATERGVDGWPWPTMRDYLVEKLPRMGGQRVDEMLDEGRFVDESGRTFRRDSPFTPQTFVFFHRDLPTETPVPAGIGILYSDERILVVDKPHFLSSIPRGRHVLESVVVRLRTQLGLPELTVAHRLDRVTAGVLLLTRERKWRRPYQEIFERREVVKKYRLVAPVVHDPAGEGVTATKSGWQVRSRIIKERGILQAREVPGVPNAVTDIALIGEHGGWGLYEASPRTGRTHQIRLHMQRLGAPIVNDPFYPVVLDTPVDDFTHPLQLQAWRMGFTDPVTGDPRAFTSRLRLAAWQ
ncbi:RNA pseudouridine synthase [Propionibacterium sp. 434-HC2]|nr:putative RNA pseudouridylate synthase [Cutibacterium acnes 266]EFD03816.1 RNA pseudouridine synthase [Cutibacterium acnes SK187]EFD07466.1 RNA pseudouridine synthase [Cutibacterium acnes J165]EGL43755.1 RNA pseudouridine synthase [Propionibacterium sp. 434-HC2]MCW5106516.1 RNA pseudouridine synthase [Cutibacterium acnes P07A]